MANPLDQLLTTLDVRLRAFAVCEVRHGWSLAFDPMDAVVWDEVVARTGEDAAVLRPQRQPGREPLRQRLQGPKAKGYPPNLWQSRG